MRKLLTVFSASIVSALPLAAQEAEAPRSDLLTPSGGLMVWTLLIFAILWFILAKFAFPPILSADEVQKIMTDARATADKVRADIVEQAHKEQQSMLERARIEIGQEKEKAMVELRKQTVELAVRAAGKVIERNLDVETNRAVVETFLATIEPVGAKK